jgi:hypothetical protein
MLLSVVPVASRNTNSGEIPFDRVTFAFKFRAPLVAEQVAPGEPRPPVPTVILNGARSAEDVPSVTLILMLPKVPAAEGVPVSAPVAVLNDAQFGMCWMLKVSIAPVPAVVVGVKEYAVPTVAVVAGVPEIVGGTVTVALIEFEPAELVQVSV